MTKLSVRRPISVESSKLERKLAAILAADVAGYTRLMDSDEEGNDVWDLRVALESASRLASSTRPGW